MRMDADAEPVVTTTSPLFPKKDLEELEMLKQLCKRMPSSSEYQEKYIQKLYFFECLEKIRQTFKRILASKDHESVLCSFRYQTWVYVAKTLVYLKKSKRLFLKHIVPRFSMDDIICMFIDNNDIEGLKRYFPAMDIMSLVYFDVDEHDAHSEPVYQMLYAHSMLYPKESSALENREKETSSLSARKRASPFLLSLAMCDLESNLFVEKMWVEYFNKYSDACLKFPLALKDLLIGRYFYYMHHQSERNYEDLIRPLVSKLEYCPKIKILDFAYVETMSRMQDIRDIVKWFCDLERHGYIVTELFAYVWMDKCVRHLDAMIKDDSARLFFKTHPFMLYLLLEKYTRHLATKESTCQIVALLDMFTSLDDDDDDKGDKDGTTASSTIEFKFTTNCWKELIQEEMKLDNPAIYRYFDWRLDDILGSALSDEEIGRVFPEYPAFQRKCDFFVSKDNQIECPICMESNVIGIPTKCFHFMCRTCYLQCSIASNACPFCKDSNPFF